jgi:HK97 family phage prohead protease
VFNRTAVIYDSAYYRWEETIRPGAFSRAIREGQDVRSLFNHDPNFVLGRTTSGTLALTEDATGLYQVTEAPTTQTVEDLVLSPIKRKDITGQSFSFIPIHASTITVTEDKSTGTEVYNLGGEIITCRYEGEKLIESHDVLDVDLFDVGPVTYPAFTATDVSMRSTPGYTERIRQLDRPHIRKTPRLDAARKLLDARSRR